MDDTLDLVENKEVVLAKIDALHEQHRLLKLRKLVDEFNLPRSDVMCINYNEETSPEELICCLWGRNQAIPSGLTFGEPYDSCFLQWYSFNYEIGTIRQKDFILLGNLFRYADQLPSFIVYALQANTVNMSQFSYLQSMNKQISQELPTLFQGKDVSNVKQLQHILRRSSLSKLDLIYLTVLCESYWLFGRALSLKDFVTIMQQE